MRLLIFFVLYSFSIAHASFFSNIELNEVSRHPFLNTNLEADSCYYEKRQIIPKFLKKLEKCFESACKGESASQQLILDYFKGKINAGIVPFSSSEVKFLKKIPLEQWTLYLETYNDIFATLCVVKANKSLEWNFPEIIKQQINTQAKKGNSNAQFTLGLMYDLGVGEPQDFITALHWYTLAAHQGHAGAMKNIGDIYCVQQDLKQALYWYMFAADQGHARAQFNLGTLHYYGIEVPQNYVEALYWYLCAALQGLSSAQFNVGAMYYKGRGVLKDHNLAFYWCKKASLQNYIDAQYKLGLLLLDDQSIYSDYDQSMKWLLTAAKKGHVSSQEAIKNFFIKKNVHPIQAEDNVFNLNNNGNHIYEMIKNTVQNLYEAHKVEAIFNNPEKESPHYLREKKFAIGVAPVKTDILP